MHNFITTLLIVLFAVLSLTISTNLSTLSRTSQYLKEDIEIAVHDASLQIDNEQLANGTLIFDHDKAYETFIESFELNTGLTNNKDYKIVEFTALDHSNTTFPIDYESNSSSFEDTFFYPTIIAVIETDTKMYFYTEQTEPVLRVASYSYQLKQNNPPSTMMATTNLGSVSSIPNQNGMHWAVPYTKNVTSHFNPNRIHPITGKVKAHKGTDIADTGVENKPVVSVLDGEISYAGVMRGYGNIVQISHGNGFVTRYAHLNSIQVKMGQKVTGGQVIGLVGNTGDSTGAHLHFETIYKGQHIDPMSFY